MFDHLVRGGIILFLTGITILTKVSPTLKLKHYSQSATNIQSAQDGSSQ